MRPLPGSDVVSDFVRSEPLVPQALLESIEIVPYAP